MTKEVRTGAVPVSKYAAKKAARAKAVNESIETKTISPQFVRIPYGLGCSGVL